MVEVFFQNMDVKAIILKAQEDELVCGVCYRISNFTFQYFNREGMIHV